MVESLIELSNLNGVSGHENDVREYIKSRISPLADTVRVDNLGSVIAFKKGKIGEKTVLITAHMDEVGLIVSSITDTGFLKFKPVGNIDTRNIVSKCVKVGNDVDGILGMKAIHLQQRAEREKVVASKDLYIDIGAKDKADALKRVKLGDYVSFSTKAFRLGKNICGKALDGRSGCACLIELMKNEYDHDVYFIFTAQREVGMRGAMTAAHGIKADRALVIEGIESADMYGAKDREQTAKLGGGVCVDFMDKYAIPDRRMTERLYEFLNNAGIDVQKKQSAIGLTDAGGIQRSREGVATVCIAVPVRYSHTPTCVISENDLDAATRAAEIFAGKAGDVF